MDGEVEDLVVAAAHLTEEVVVVVDLDFLVEEVAVAIQTEEVVVAVQTEEVVDSPVVGNKVEAEAVDPIGGGDEFMNEKYICCRRYNMMMDSQGRVFIGRCDRRQAQNLC